MVQAEINIYIEKWLMRFASAAADALGLLVDESFTNDDIPVIREKALYALNILAHDKMRKDGNPGG